MCGIAGAFVYDSKMANLDLFYEAVKASRGRGTDSFGVVEWTPSSGWFEFRRFQATIDDCIEDLKTEDGALYLHTSRAEPTTEWKKKKTERDIPPFKGGHIAVAHNGIISNDHELVKQYDIVRQSNIDTTILPELIGRIGVWRTIRELKSGNALGIIDVERGRLYLCRNFLPLVIAWQPGIVAFASEAKFFPGSDELFPSFRLWILPPFSAMEFSFKGYRGPVQWGFIPDFDENEWKPYPDF